MLKTLFLFVVALVLLNFSQLFSAEITINWRQKLDSGMVDDLKFMPGQEQFILSSGQMQKFTEIRSCEDGSILQSYPFGGSQFEFTPDSTKLIFMSGPHIERGELQLRKLSDMSLLAQYQLPKDEELPYSYFWRIAVDPVRPLIYAIWTRTNNLPSGITKRKIMIFNRETLQPIEEFINETDSSMLYSEIAVSKDGKFLATINTRISKLVVWSLDTRQKIVDKFISDQNSDEFSDPANIKFSELNTDKIYFTGQFYKSNDDEFAGLCIFSISENRIIDSTFALPPNRYGINPEICLFQNETKVIGSSRSGTLKVLDLIEKKIEYEKNILGVNLIAGRNLNNHNKEKYFIGGGGNTIDRFMYNPNTSITTETSNKLIYPNPTTGTVNIPIICHSSVTYKIFDINGILLKSNVVNATTTPNLLTIDCSDLSKGVYTIQIICDKTVSLYQIVRGE